MYRIPVLTNDFDTLLILAYETNGMIDIDLSCDSGNSYYLVYPDLEAFMFASQCVSQFLNYCLGGSDV